MAPLKTQGSSQTKGARKVGRESLGKHKRVKGPSKLAESWNGNPFGGPI